MKSKITIRGLDKVVNSLKRQPNMIRISDKQLVNFLAEYAYQLKKELNQPKRKKK